MRKIKPSGYELYDADGLDLCEKALRGHLKTLLADIARSQDAINSLHKALEQIKRIREHAKLD